MKRIAFTLLLMALSISSVFSRSLPSQARQVPQENVQGPPEFRKSAHSRLQNVRHKRSRNGTGASLTPSLRLTGTRSVFTAATNYWQSTNGPNMLSGNVRSSATSSRGHIFVGTNGQGILRSTDNGDNWVPVNTGLTNFSVFALAINSSGDIFAGTNGQGVFRSTDNGDTWTPVNTDLTGLNVYALAINSRGDIFAGTNGQGIFRSTNKGAKWDQVNTNLTFYYIRSLAITSGGVILAGTGSEGGQGVFRSNDNGTTWEQKSSGLPLNVVARSLAINAGGDIFVGTNGYGVYRSANTGDTWTPTTLTTTHTTSLIATPLGYVFAGTDHDGIYRLDTGGNTWTHVITDVGLGGNTKVFTLTINSRGDIFAGTGQQLAGFSNNGLFRSTNNGGVWTKVGVLPVDATALAINRNGVIFAGTDDAGIFRSLDNGQQWTLLSLLPQNSSSTLLAATVTSIVINSSGHIFAATDDEYIRRSTDNGTTWTELNNSNGLTNGVVNALAINSQGNIFAATDGSYVYRSNDNGNSWTQLSNGLLNNEVIALAINNSSGTIFAGALNYVYRSADNGDSWTQLTSSLTSGEIKSLAVNSRGDIFVGTDGSGVNRSTDNGNTWTLLTAGLVLMGEGPYLPEVQSLFIDSHGIILAGTDDDGIFGSSDNGSTWTNLSNGLPIDRPFFAGTVYSIIANAAGTIFLGTEGGGVYKTAGPGPPAQITIISGNNQSGQVYSPLNSFVVMVRDADGLPVPGVTTNFTLVFAPNGQSGSGLSRNSVVTDAAGLASSSLLLGSLPGSYVVAATVQTLPDVSARFNATATIGAPSQLLKINGDFQTGRASSPLVVPLTVSVVDIGGNPVPGISVTYSVFATPFGAIGHGVSPASALSNSSGQASASMTLGDQAGQYRVSVTSPYLGGTFVIFTETATNPAPIASRISPASAGRGSRLSVTVTGTNFSATASTLTFGSDITINSQTVVNSTTITANITVSLTAIPGVRDVIVTNVSPGGGAAAVPGGFTIDSSTPTSVETVGSAIPESYALQPAYPNPFNPSTRVRFALPEESKVKVLVYNVLGVQVDDLIGETLAAGTYNVVWNADRFPSGSYIVRMQAQSTNSSKQFNSSTRVMLLK